MVRSESIKKLDDLKGEYVVSFLKLCDDGKHHKVFMSSDNRTQLLRNSWRSNFVIYTRSEYEEMYSKKKQSSVKRKASNNNQKDRTLAVKKIITGNGYKLTEFFTAATIKSALGEYDKQKNQNYSFDKKDLLQVYSHAKQGQLKIKKELEVAQLINKIRM